MALHVSAVLQPQYADRGLVAPVPVAYARQMGAEVVLAVDISAAPEGNATGDTLRLLMQTLAIMGRSLNALALRDADVVLRPALAGVAGTDFGARRRAIDAGREAAAVALPALRERLAAAVR